MKWKIILKYSNGFVVKQNYDAFTLNEVPFHCTGKNYVISSVYMIEIDYLALFLHKKI